ncbi:FtsX-like permease family protein [Leptolyngbya sp. FACHB-36]|uniref:ABC transporter permease DevC n=1 Tax=Leptolyngbya sp. FACHB-36 TaxID=2692808 RepID=UPI001680D2C6|nr:ABC transporter permease DevC [Leptolyngbya sp. FACHB-36]MBD2018905.1 FtsX-like permease family protein [Leptolyngbya sp. FACHB-36]
MKRIPLAWLQLTKERSRMIVAIAGIAFADVLMFLQMGFRSALFDGAVQLHNSLDGDVFLVSDRYKALIALDRFTERRLYQALGYAGVQSVSPVYLGPVQWKNPENKQVWNLYAIGVNPADNVLLLPPVQANLNSLKQPDTVMFDEGARKEFGPVPALFRQGAFTTEVENRQVEVVGLFKLGTSFGINGTLITSDINFLRLFQERRQKGLIDVGVIKLEPGADVAQVVANLRSGLPNDVRVMSKQEFMDREKNFWNTSTPVGYVFDLGAVIGFIVGAVIVYQILYSDVSDHMPEYATLKAIGFRDRYLLAVVFQEALILAAIGFVPGLAISLGFYQVTRQATLLPMVMTLGRAGFVLALTAMMCSISAAIAIRKLQSADPADSF